MSQRLVSILLNTIDRYDLTVKCIGPALESAGYPFELLICDNGSKDQRTIDYIKSLEPAYLRLNETNEGCGQMHNQMLLRSKGHWFCLLDNDIEIKGSGWLRALVETYEKIEDSGVIGIHTDNLCPEKHAPKHYTALCPVPVGAQPDDPVVTEQVTIFEAVQPKEDAVFGTRLFGRQVLDKVGFFCEEYGPYALVDNEYNSRVHWSGFRNYYIDWSSGYHHGWDVGESSEYRRMKDESMRRAGPVLLNNMRRYREQNNWYLPPPALR